MKAVSDEVLARSRRTPKHVFGCAVSGNASRISRIYALNALKRVKTPVAVKATLPTFRFFVYRAYHRTVKRTSSALRG